MDRGYKYQIGQTVRIRADLDPRELYYMLSGPRRYNYSRRITTKTIRNLGEEAQIQEYSVGCYYAEAQKGDYMFLTDEMIEDSGSAGSLKCCWCESLI